MSKGKHEEHEEHVNHEAWVIPYADMLTLLMGLFLMLYAMSTLDMKKFQEMATSLRTSFGGGTQVVDAGMGSGGGAGSPSIAAGGLGPFDGLISGLSSAAREEMAAGALQREEARRQAIAEESEQLQQVQLQIGAQAEAAGLGENVNFRMEARGLVVTVVTDQVLFAPGSATLNPEKLVLLDGLAGALRDLPNPILIEGHTDSIPINTAQFPSNWELSTARATSVLRYLLDVHGLSQERLSAAGYADTRPVATNDTVEGRAQNRRVEVVVQAMAGGSQAVGTVNAEPTAAEPTAAAPTVSEPTATTAPAAGEPAGAEPTTGAPTGTEPSTPAPDTTPTSLDGP